MPSLSFLCLQVTAQNFLTHVLRSRETFNAVAAQERQGKGRAQNQTIASSRPSKKPRIVSRGIGGRPILDEEMAAGRDWLPGHDGDEDDSEGEQRQSMRTPGLSRLMDVGIAATPMSMRSREDSNPGNAPHTVSLSASSTADLHETIKENHRFLKILPDHTLINLLRLLRTHCPQALTRHILTTYFVVGRAQVELDTSMTLFADRPEDINLILKSASLAGAAACTDPDLNAAQLYRGAREPRPAVSLNAIRPLRRLNLSGMTRLDPVTLSSLFRRCTVLEEVILKGCVRVDADCLSALIYSGDNADTLRVLNVNFTEVGLQGIETVASHCRNLRVLKIANVTGINDRSAPEMLRRCMTVASSVSRPFVPLSKLETLKLRATDLGPVGISSFIQLCSQSLQNLDLASLGLMTIQGASALTSVLGIDVGASGKQSGLDASTAVLPSRWSPAPALRKLNLSDNLPPHSRPRDIETALPLLMRLIPPFAETLEVLLLDNLGLEWKNFRLIQQGIADHLERKREELEKQGTFAVRTLALKRLSLSGSLPTILESQDFRSGEVQEAKHDISLKSMVQDLSLSGVDLRRSVYQKMDVSIPYDDEDDAAAIEVPLSSVSRRSWGNVQKLDLSYTQISDVELAAFSSCLAAPRGDDHKQQEGTASSSLREIVLAGTSVTSEGIKSLLRRCPFVERVDLTGCRGVGVRERRGIFESLEGDAEDGVQR